MVKEAKTQAKVCIGVETLWKAVAKDLQFVLPKIQPIIQEVDVIGDGGLGTVFCFHFALDASTKRTQREKIVELDESRHRIGIQITEGIVLENGYSLFITTVQLKAVGDTETLVDVKVVYETKTEAKEAGMPTQLALDLFKRLEKYLLQSAS